MGRAKSVHICHPKKCPKKASKPSQDLGLLKLEKRKSTKDVPDRYRRSHNLAEVSERSETDLLEEINELISALSQKHQIHGDEYKRKTALLNPTKALEAQRILCGLREYVDKNAEKFNLEDVEYDRHKFQNDLSFFREWFRSRESRLKGKYDYFYGPLCEDPKEARRINQSRPRSLEYLENKSQGGDHQSQSKRSARRSGRAASIQASKKPHLHYGGRSGFGEVHSKHCLTREEYIADLKTYYMRFDETITNTQTSVKKNWKKIYDMIAGPEHEYNYLKRLIRSYKIKIRQREEKIGLIKTKINKNVKIKMIARAPTLDQMALLNLSNKKS